MLKEEEEITFECPKCDAVLSVHVSELGLEGECPLCFAMITVPFAIDDPQVTQHEQLDLFPQSRSESKFPPKKAPERVEQKIEVSSEEEIPVHKPDLQQKPLLNLKTKWLFASIIIGISTIIAFLLSNITLFKDPSFTKIEATIVAEVIDKQAIAPEKTGFLMPKLLKESQVRLSSPSLSNINLESRMPNEVVQRFFTETLDDKGFSISETQLTEKEFLILMSQIDLPKLNEFVEEVLDQHPTYDFVDHHFSAVLAQKAQTIIVRVRDGKSRLLVDPLIQNLQGNLVDFLLKPRKKRGIFSVILYPVADTVDEVNSMTSLIAVDFLEEVYSAPVGRAYVRKDSVIGKQIISGTHGLAYGQAQVATVELGWSGVENGFPEIKELKSLYWSLE